MRSLMSHSPVGLHCLLQDSYTCFYFTFIGKYKYTIATNKHGRNIVRVLHSQTVREWILCRPWFCLKSLWVNSSLSTLEVLRSSYECYLTEHRLRITSVRSRASVRLVREHVAWKSSPARSSVPGCLMRHQELWIWSRSCRVLALLCLYSEQAG
jgi:hypothetical protein